MEKTIIAERTGWEYELKNEQYYPTGHVMKNGVLTPSEIPNDIKPKDEKHIDVWGQRHLRYSDKITNGCTLIFQRFLCAVQ